MENIIIKFKNDLKSFQLKRKKTIKECERELTILIKMINGDIETIRSIKTESIGENLFMATTIGAIDLSIKSLSDEKARKKETKKAKERIQEIYNSLLTFTEEVKKDYVITQNIINAFENDKIKDPINSIKILFNQMPFTTLTIEEIDKILGMAIAFNSQYAKRNKNHQIENIDTIHELAENYYNKDGSFKYNEDILTYEKRISELVEDQPAIISFFHQLMSFNKIYKIQDLLTLRLKKNKFFRETQPTEVYYVQKEEKEINLSIKENVIIALQELKKYYKNGTIIAIPNNLEEFYLLLEKTNLDEQEKKYIINLLNIEIAKKRNIIIDTYLSAEQKNVYNFAIELLNKLTYPNPDINALKQYIEELQTILEFLVTEKDNENKEYLLNEINIIIEQLIIICNGYKDEDIKSTNRIIFLTDKNEIPYIDEDIKSVDSTYKKPILSLITKITKENESHFRKILSTEQLPYYMYEVISQRAHVAFVEIDAGIYLIIGANIPRNGYKEFINRLNANQKKIQRIESLIKTSTKRNQILKEHEQYLEEFSKENSTLTRKKTAK